MSLFKQEMVRTAPPDKCSSCTSDGNCRAQEHVQDNRHELYRDFAFVPSDIPNEYVVVCKHCLKSVFVREGLYRIINPNGQARLSWVIERVRCISCGRSWSRKEKEDGEQDS